MTRLALVAAILIAAVAVGVTAVELSYSDVWEENP